MPLATPALDIETGTRLSTWAARSAKLSVLVSVGVEWGYTGVTVGSLPVAFKFNQAPPSSPPPFPVTHPLEGCPVHPCAPTFQQRTHGKLLRQRVVKRVIQIWEVVERVANRDSSNPLAFFGRVEPRLGRHTSDSQNPLTLTWQVAIKRNPIEARLPRLVATTDCVHPPFMSLIMWGCELQPGMVLGYGIPWYMQRDGAPSVPSPSLTPGAAVFAGACGPDPSLSDDAVGSNGLLGSGAVVDMGALVPGHSAQREEPCTRISNRAALPMPTLPLPASAAPSTARGWGSGDTRAESASDGRSREHHPIVHATAHNIMPLGKLC